MALIEEWEVYAAQGVRVDSERFGDLLYECHSNDDLRRILTFSPYREDAVARLSGFFADTVQDGYFYPAPRFRLDDSGLIAEARQMLGDAATYLGTAEKTNLAQNLREIDRFTVVGRQEVRSLLDAGNELHADYLDVLGDVFGRKLARDRRRLYPLDEALYRLTTSFDVTRYLMSVLLDEKHAFDAAYRFWRGGGGYCVRDGECLISHDYD